MNLYLISNGGIIDYNKYDSAIVAANTVDEAKMIHPDGRSDWDGDSERFGTWTVAACVDVKWIGVTDVMEKGVILASFNAG